MKDSISDNNKTWDFLGIKSKADEKDNNKICTDFRWLQTTCMNKWDAVGGGFTNFLPWLFVNIFAIGLMWMMVKTAIAWSSITSKIGNNIMKMWANALWSIPLLKIWGVWVGATSLSKAPSMISNNFDTIQRQRNAEWDKKLQELLDPSLKKDTGAFAIKDEVKEKLKTSIMSPTPNNKSLEAHFNDNLDEENKKIFNWLSPNERSNQIIKFLEESKISPEQNKISDLIENWYKSFINNTTQKIEDGKISEFITYINGTTIINAINKDNTLKGKIQKAGEWKIQFSNNKRTTVTPQ
jgi:hypothetical protein